MNKYIHSKWTVRCSFCGQKGHNIRSCSDVIPASADLNYEKWDAFRVAVAQGEVKRRKQLAERTLVPRRKPRCGFCGNKKHNRKNCHKLKKVRKQLYNGNARWRRKFVERVNVLGIGSGALVEVTGVPVGALTTLPARGAPLSKHRHLGIIEPFDCEAFNVFCNFLGVWDYRSQADVKAKVTTERGFISISLGKYIGEDLFHKNAFFSQYNSVKVISRSQWASPSKWIEEKNIPSLEWLIKNHSLEELKDFHIISFIEKWT